MLRAKVALLIVSLPPFGGSEGKRDPFGPLGLAVLILQPSKVESPLRKRFVTSKGVDWDLLEEFVQSKVERESGDYQPDSRDYLPDFLPPLHMLDPPIGLDEERHSFVKRFLPVLLGQAQITRQRAVFRYYMTRSLSGTEATDLFPLPSGLHTHSAFDEEGKPNPLFQLRAETDSKELQHTRCDRSSIIHSKEQFETNLWMFAGIDLKSFLSPNIFLTGSAVYLSLTGEDPNKVAPNSDLNVFIAAPTLPQGEMMHKEWLTRVSEHLGAFNIVHRILKGCLGTTIACGSPIRKIGRAHV